MQSVGEGVDIIVYSFGLGLPDLTSKILQIGILDG